ncbi:hypothetical protein B0H13DRAFT_1902881 [Mycena leptocephala]|nr:hypothetical protein B0H13DRAFT_1902881 [Mycena leptocephala]
MQDRTSNRKGFLPEFRRILVTDGRRLSTRISLSQVGKSTRLENRGKKRKIIFMTQARIERAFATILLQSAGLAGDRCMILEVRSITGGIMGITRTRSTIVDSALSTCQAYGENSVQKDFTYWGSESAVPLLDPASASARSFSVTRTVSRQMDNRLKSRTQTKLHKAKTQDRPSRTTPMHHKSSSNPPPHLDMDTPSEILNTSSFRPNWYIDVPQSSSFCMIVYGRSGPRGFASLDPVLPRQSDQQNPLYSSGGRAVRKTAFHRFEMDAKPGCAHKEVVAIFDSPIANYKTCRRLASAPFYTGKRCRDLRGRNSQQCEIHQTKIVSTAVRAVKTRDMSAPPSNKVRDNYRSQVAFTGKHHNFKPTWP